MLENIFINNFKIDDVNQYILLSSSTQGNELSIYQ